MTTPIVSVIMSVFNEQRYLSKSIESLLQQTFKDFEFIIVDDASTDASFGIMQGYASKDGRIILIKNPVNQGLASSLNNALSAVKGEFIARMDADDTSVKNRLEVQLEFLGKNPGIALAGSSIELIDPDGNIIARSDAVDNPAILKKLIFYKNICPHPTWMFRKGILKDLKGYRSLPAAQDYDFLMRLYSAGYEISNINIPLLHYRVHERKISFDGSLTQIKLSRYLRKLYRNGLILNNRFFEKGQATFAPPSKILQRIHSLSLRLFEKGRFLIKDNSPISGVLLLCVSAMLSPYMAYFIYCGFRAKLIEKSAGN